MNKIMDWILSQMRLVDTGEEYEEPEQEMVPLEKSWLELVQMCLNRCFIATELLEFF